MSFLRRLYSFRGRLGRTGYWLTEIGGFIGAAAVGFCLLLGVLVVGDAVGAQSKTPVQMAMAVVTLLILTIAFGIPMLAAIVKRLRDRGRTTVPLWIAAAVAAVSAFATSYAMSDALGGVSVATGPFGLLALAAGTVPIGALPVALVGFVPLFSWLPSAIPAAIAATVLLLTGLWLAIELGFLGPADVAAGDAKSSGPAAIPRAAPPIFHRPYIIASCVSLSLLVAGGAASYFAVRDSRFVASTRDCPECPEMIAIPAGSFIMGIDDWELNPKTGQKELSAYAPAHRVSVPAFLLGKYEVTFDEWDACVKAGGCKAVTDDRGWGRGRRPVIGVSWRDGHDYVQWLSSKTGKSYRLASEAQWEFAARGGSTWPQRFLPLKWRTDLHRTCRFENVGDLSYKDARDQVAPCKRDGKPIACEFGNIDCRDGFAATAPVGSFGPNYFGLHDMQGNVAEWIEDCWHYNFAGSPPTDGSAWIAGDCSNRMIRGQDWKYWLPWGNYTLRWFDPANDRTNSDGSPAVTHGLRVARNR
jgi:formylglycine-generating enzyme required for sulfatase activity/uncharacterized membrane protein YhaH (DUF805 family)